MGQHNNSAEKSGKARWGIIRVPHLSKWLSFDVSRIFIIEKQTFTYVLLVAGMLFAYLGSLHPWFMWPFKEAYPLLSAMLIIVSVLVANSMRNSMYDRSKVGYAVILYIITAFYLLYSTEAKLLSYIITFFSIAIFYAIERVNQNVLERLLTFFCKFLAVALAISLTFHILHVAGFSFPSVSTSYNNQYYYNNYFLFMVDDRFLSTIFPRFSSVFLEPGHLGTATSLLLMTQFGKWKKWYNVILIIVSLATFSLAAYGILFVLAFLNLWVQRKKIIGKLIGLTIFMSIVVTIGLTYNDGDNLFSNLILARMEVDEKTDNIVGNNRVTEGFEREFDSFMTSSDVFFGRSMNEINKDEGGNSGYRVYIFENGLIGLLLVVIFYVYSFRHYQDSRMLISAIIVSLMIFWIRGYPLWYSNFIPLMACANARAPLGHGA